MIGEFVPGVQRLGLQPSDAWATLYGTYPQIQVVLLAESAAQARSAMESGDWTLLQDRLFSYIKNYSHKIVPRGVGFNSSCGPPEDQNLAALVLCCGGPRIGGRRFCIGACPFGRAFTGAPCDVSPAGVGRRGRGVFRLPLFARRTELTSSCGTGSRVLGGLTALALAAALFLLRYLDPRGCCRSMNVSVPCCSSCWRSQPRPAFLALALRHGFRPAGLGPLRRPWWVFAGLLGAILLLVAVTRLGLTPDPAYWGETGVPLQGWQFASARHWRAGAVGGAILPRPSLLIPALIYLLALALWLSVPGDVLRNGFYVSIDPPTYQPLPYSDASYYDSMAQSLFTGHPYRGRSPRAPCISSCWGCCTCSSASAMTSILVGQTVVLGVDPGAVLLAGGTAALAGGGDRPRRSSSSSTSGPWILSPPRRVLEYPHAAGGPANPAPCAASLPAGLPLAAAGRSPRSSRRRWRIRPAAPAADAIRAILRVILLAAALTLRPFPRSFLRLSGFFLLGFALTVSPWLLHNYLLTGEFAFDAAFQYKVIASQYAYTGNLDLPTLTSRARGWGRCFFNSC